MNFIKIIFIIGFFIIGFLCPNSANSEPWSFVLTSKTKSLSDDPFILSAVGDINGNGINEIVVANFGLTNEYLPAFSKKDKYYSLLVLEWDRGEVREQWKKQWDRMKSFEERSFWGGKAEQMIVWPAENRSVLETIPPYLGLEWESGKYVLREQQGYSYKKGSLVGSWMFDWITPSCYRGFGNGADYPRECLIGVRSFSEGSTKRLVSLLTEEVKKDKQYKQTLRVRKIQHSWPIEWEMLLDPKKSKRGFYSGPSIPIEKSNWDSYGGMASIVVRHFLPDTWYLLQPSKKEKGYQIAPILAKLYIGNILQDPKDPYLDTGNLNRTYVASTKERGRSEFWGYRRFEERIPEGFLTKRLLREISLSPDSTSFIKEEVLFPTHENFLGVGYFDVTDVDGDGLDEVIAIEETAKLKIMDEEVTYLYVKDYIHILKWNGKEYMEMWVSPPIQKRGTRFIVADIKKSGNKQLIVLNPEGSVEIWEKK